MSAPIVDYEKTAKAGTTDKEKKASVKANRQ